MSDALKTISFLDVSTAHITEDDNALLMHASATLFTPAVWGKDMSSSFSSSCPVVIHPFCYGFMVHVNEEIEREDVQREILEFGFSQHFLNLLLAGHQAGTRYLMLDCDGETYTDRPTFNW